MKEKLPSTQESPRFTRREVIGKGLKRAGYFLIAASATEHVVKTIPESREENTLGKDSEADTRFKRDSIGVTVGLGIATLGHKLGDKKFPQDHPPKSRLT